MSFRGIQLRSGPLTIWSPGTRRALSFAVLLLTALVGVHCSEEPTAPGKGGALELQLRLAEGLQLSGDADSLRFWVRDAEGGVLSGPAVVAYSGDSFDLDLRIPQGAGRVVQVRLESNGFRERGVAGWGEATGLTVEAARTTEVSLVLAEVVPQLWPILAQPGDLAYVVSWTPRALAGGYELLEIQGEEESLYALSDTLFTVSLTDLGDAGAEVTYRVRTLGPFGTSNYGDALTFRPGEVRDLPHIVAVDPSPDASGVLDTTEPTLTFDRPMDWSSLTEQSVQILDLDSGQPFEVLADGAGATLTVSHFEAFPRGRRLRLDVPAGLLGADGRAFDQDPATEGLQGFSSEFSVEVYAPLQVSAVAPLDAAGNVSILDTIELDLSREFDPSTATVETVELRDALGDRVAGALTVTATRILLTPDAPLEYEANYTVHVSTDVLDLRGEPLDQDASTTIPVFEAFSSAFSTESQPLGARVMRSLPAADEQNWPVFADVEIEFDRAIDVSTVQAQSTFNVRKLPVGASISGTIESDSERRIFTFHPTNSLEQGTSYQIDLTVGILDDNGVPMDQDPDEAGFQGFQAGFRAEENIRVTGVTPQNGETRIPPDTQIQLEFNLPADPARLGPESVTLEQGGTFVEIDRSLSADGRVATLSAPEPLRLFTEYIVRINENLWSREGSRFDQDTSEDGYQPFLTRFTTRPESIPPMVVAVTPEDMAEAVERRPELRVTFSKPIQPGSFNSSTVLFRPVGGELVATALSVSADSLVGSLGLPSDLDLNTEYVIEITNWIVDPFDVRLDQDPFTPDRQGFASSFRTDVERVPPWVITVRPARGSVDVPLATAVELDFSEPVDPTTLAAGVFLEFNGALVDGQVSAISNNQSARFVPTAPLLENRIYNVRVTEAVTDLVGNPLDDDPGTPELDPFTSDFTTEQDQLGPFVLTVNPVDGEAAVEPDVGATLVFSEAIDTTTVLLAVSLEDSTGAAVPLQEIEIVSMHEVRMIPAEELETLHRYTIVVASSLRDTVGNAFDQDPKTPENDPFESQFTTREERKPPQAIGAFFDDQPPPQTTLIRVVFTEPMDISSLDPEDVVLRTTDGGIVAPVLLSFAAPDTMNVRPVSQLLASTRYELIVTDLLDLVGNALDQFPGTPELDPFIKLFTTARDSQSPLVEESSPADGETGVLADAVISLLFDEPMNPASFNDTFYGVIRIEGSQEFPVNGEITWDTDQRQFFFTPNNMLLRGFHYLIRADFHLEDLAGNPLDQDRSTSVDDPFLAEFLVGETPVAAAGAPVCRAESTLVTVDGSASFDPDGVIARAIWQWGDGSADTELISPAPEDLIVEHTYPCLDIAGCDGIDNDGDGIVDDDCDESYQIILRIVDEDGLSSLDTTGVSFCGFAVLATTPAAEAVDVDTLLAEVSIDFTHFVADTSLTTENFEIFSLETVVAVGVDTIRFGDDAATVVLELTDPLAAETEYELRVTDPVDDEGRPYDADPCTPTPDPFVIRFTTQPATEPRRPSER